MPLSSNHRLPAPSNTMPAALRSPRAICTGLETVRLAPSSVTTTRWIASAATDRLPPPANAAPPPAAMPTVSVGDVALELSFAPTLK
jgi:hypothetical protein